MTTYAITRPKFLPAPPPTQPNAVRRLFDNTQLIERFDKWLQITGKRPNTRVGYGFTVKQFSKRLMDKSLAAATKQDMLDYIGYLYNKGLSAASIRAHHFALRTFYDFLQMGNQVNASIPRYVLMRKLPVRFPDAKSEEDIESLIAAARKLRDIALLELGYASGLRVSELANLRVEDLDLAARSLVVRDGKGGNDRLGLFGRKAAHALKIYLRDRQNGPVFCREPRRQQGGVTRGQYGDWWGQWRERDDNGNVVMRNVRLGDYDIPNRERARLALKKYFEKQEIVPICGKPAVSEHQPLTTRSIYRIIVGIASRAGITNVYPHILRHSMATHMLNRGMDVRFVQQLLGHANVATTAKYLHVAIARLQEVHAKFFERDRHD